MVRSDTEHYFTAEPASPADLRTIDVRLGGHELVVRTAPGVFSAEHLDHATKVLLDHAPPPPATGTFLDLGCGWGPVALALALAAPQARIVAVDVNERALDLTRLNAAAAGLTNVVVSRPEDVAPEARFDVIWSNPPIRIGKEALHELLATWLPRLTENGTAYLVVGKNLGADSLARWLTSELGAPTWRVASVKGFRVLEVGRPTR